MSGKRPGEKIKMMSVDELLGVPSGDPIEDIEVSLIYPFKDHPFKVVEDEKMEELIESIRWNGVLTPVTVRPKKDGTYEMISGHRRLYAVNKIGLDYIPAYVKEMDDDEATIAMVDSNIQREEILPSEKAFAYRMRYEAMRHQGSKKTSSQVGTKLRADEELAEQVGESRNQVHRFIRLTEVIPELLDMIDRGNVAVMTGVDVSLHTVNKLNESYDAMTITPVGSNIGVNLSIDRFYEAMDHGVSYEEDVNRATTTVMDALENTPSVDVAKLTDYDTMKDKLVMEVVSAETNADMLKNIPHKNMEDMAVVYRFVLDSDENGRASILVTNGMLETMGVTPEQLHADAMENSPELKPAVIKGMSEVVAEMMGMSKEDMAMMGMPTDPENEQMFVATVPDKVHGAGVLAYQDFMDQAAERVGGECLVICWSDLDFEKKIIRVEKNLVYRPEPESGCVARITTPKTDAGKRTIPMLDEVYDAFLEEYQIQKILGFSTQEIDGYSGFVFSTNGGNAYIPECVNGAIDRITKDYNE